MGAMIYRPSEGKHKFLMVIAWACGIDLDFCGLKHWLRIPIANDSNFLKNHNKSIVNKKFSL
jgi:hypothetical protein